MDMQQFVAVSPLEVGDRVLVEGASGVSWDEHKVTDILLVQSARRQTAWFMYELDGGPETIPIAYIRGRKVGDAYVVPVGAERSVCRTVEPAGGEK